MFRGHDPTQRDDLGACSSSDHSSQKLHPYDVHDADQYLDEQRQPSEEQYTKDCGT